METLLFFHGGPGLNSNSEQQILTEDYKSRGLAFKGWNEPSSLRGTFNSDFPGTRFEQLLDSAEKFLFNNYNGRPVYLMGHSLGCQTVARLLQKHSDKIKAVFMSAPCFHIFEADKNIFTFVQKDYEDHGDTIVSEKMKQIISSFSESFDSNIQTGWELALQNPRTFNYYWNNKSSQVSYFSHATTPEYSIDAESFLEVRKSFADIELFACDKKTIIFYSEKDPVITPEKEKAVITKHFSKLAIYNTDASSHYPHIEETEKILNIIARETNQNNS